MCNVQSNRKFLGAPLHSFGYTSWRFLPDVQIMHVVTGWFPNSGVKQFSPLCPGLERQLCVWSWGWSSREVMWNDLQLVLIPCDLKIWARCSDSPATKESPTGGSVVLVSFWPGQTPLHLSLSSCSLICVVLCGGVSSTLISGAGFKTSYQSMLPSAFTLIQVCRKSSSRSFSSSTWWTLCVDRCWMELEQYSFGLSVIYILVPDG